MNGIAYRPLSDMESNGVYFEQEPKIILTQDEPICQYSGLPAVSTYEEEKEELLIGHA